jgi:drug/metabolite transporter (DMT)-like permease
MAEIGVILAVVATAIYNLGFILEKRALATLPAVDAHHPGSLIRTLFTAPAWLAGFALILVGLLMQVVVLHLVPLTVAQPLQASGVVVTILMSRLVLHERIGRTELTCIVVIIFAVLLLGLSVGGASAAGEHASGTGIAVAAAPAVLAALAVFLFARRAARRRHRYPVSGISYGLCAGLMYGVAGLALKALSAAIFTGGHPLSAGLLSGHGILVAALLTPYFYMVFACSGTGMFLFQTALQRSPASVILPLSTIIGTGYLVLVGSWLFHERLPAGLLPLAARLVGGAAAVAVPIILAIAAERTSARARARAGRQRHRPGQLLPLYTERPWS